jgi:hypothetical protein
MNEHTDAMIMRRPAPEEPPMIATIRLGVMAMLLVNMFCCHFFNFISKNPCILLNVMNNYRCTNLV